MSITRDTPFRDIGPVPYETWRSEITNAGGRKELASREAWEAAGPMSGVLLRILDQESSFDSNYNANSKANNNPYNIRVPDRSNEGNPKGYIKYPDLVAATKAAADRITGAAGFFEGTNPYADDVTIDDLLYTYAPPGPPSKPWNDTEGLVRKMVDQLKAWFPNWSPPVTPPATDEEPVEEEPPMAITFGKVPKPTMQNRIIQNSQAWADQGQRTIRAAVWHRMYGSLWGTDGYFRGAAIKTALTDYGVGVSATDGVANAGVILLWNEPTGRRSPHASGPVDNPIGDGARFVKFWPINRDAVSIELSGSGGTALDAKARASVVALTAYYADQYGKLLASQGKKFDYTNWPYVPHEDNRSFVIWHGEVNSDKRGTCPGAVVESQTASMILEVGELLKRYQATGAQPEPVPEPEPPPPADPEIVPGVDWGIAERCFGDAFEDQGLVLTKGGPLSTLYIERCKTTGQWPSFTDYWIYDDKRRYFRFSNGWLALDPPGDAKVRWIDAA